VYACFGIPLAIVLGVEDYVKPLQLQHKYSICSSFILQFNNHGLPSSVTSFSQKKTITFDCRSSISSDLYQDVFTLSHSFGIFSAHPVVF